MKRAAFYISKATNLRLLAAYCTIGALKPRLLSRAADFEELARWANEEDLQTQEQAPPVEPHS